MDEQTHRRRLGTGCRLLLVLVVLATAGVIAAGVKALQLKREADRINAEKRAATLEKLKVLVECVKQYTKDNGPLVVPEDDLECLLTKDAWGNRVHYACPGPVHADGFDFISCGPDGALDQGRGDDVVLGDDVSGGLAAIQSQSTAGVTSAVELLENLRRGSFVGYESERAPAIGYTSQYMGRAGDEQWSGISLAALIPSWRRILINAHTFAVNYKAAPKTQDRIPERQVLLAWESGEPRRPELRGASSAVLTGAEEIPNTVGSGRGPVIYGAKARCTIWLEPSTD